MIGMIKKDLYMMMNNYKFIIVAFFIYLFYSVSFDMDMSFFLPFMGLMISISTMSYDDYNNWHAYSSTLPQGRVSVVKSKYITCTGVVLLFTIISILVTIIMGNMRGNLNIDNSLSTIMGELLAIVFVQSTIFPILFKYGAEKGRTAMIVMGIGIAGLVMLLTKVVKIDIPADFLMFLDKYMIIISISLSIILISISYLISKKLYSKREF